MGNAEFIISMIDIVHFETCDTQRKHPRVAQSESRAWNFLETFTAVGPADEKSCPTPGLRFFLLLYFEPQPSPCLDAWAWTICVLAFGPSSQLFGFQLS